ncbi:hypothetical protein R5W23_004702 [Gemmata sp. JC673]|uniref:Lipoprotein n=1 Tax=Gemmata algarum TaxID=2975278 RepID=A0ABU5F9W5_9BACT|nr:hypothetical protein [Gemmata algarum]MDY3563203.1 hypothetical protein [Gemmata algarum]
MRPRILTVGACLLLLLGCKRGARDTGPARDEVGVKPAPATPTVAEKPDTKDEPNWLKDERGRPKRDQLPVDGTTSGGKQPWNVGAPAGGAQPPTDGAQVGQSGATQPMTPPVAPPAPGGGANPAPAKPQPMPAAGNAVPALAPAGNTPLGAAKRVVAMADMRDLQLFIDTASLASGKMPSGAEIYEALVAARAPTAALVKDGAIVLTGTRERESVWAFEANAYLKGGLVVSQNGVERLTADELKQRLGK